MVVVVVIYLLIKYIINPIVKIISGILTILLIIYILQKFFNINIIQFIPQEYAQYLNFDTWANYIKNFVSQIVTQIISQIKWL
jgi:DNA integrity scanning protein DisA with diadenylate cyclase activity